MYEIVSDLGARQDTLEEKLVQVEEKVNSIQEQIELLPETLNRCLARLNERSEQRRNFLHPESATAAIGAPNIPMSFPGFAGIGATSPIFHYPPQQQTSSHNQFVHSRSAPSSTTITHHPWPTSPVLPSVSSRIPHLVPEITPEPNNGQEESMPLIQPGSSRQSHPSGSTAPKNTYIS